MPYIFISTRTDDLDFSRRVQSELEWAGYSAWIGERTEFAMPTDVEQVLDAVIRVAGAVVAIEGGDPEDIEAAGRFDKPIFYLTRRDEPLSLLPELVSLMPDEVTPAQVLLPQPLDASEVRALQAEFDQTQRSSTLLLLVGIAILVAIAVFAIWQSANRSAAQPGSSPSQFAADFHATTTSSAPAPTVAAPLASPTAELSVTPTLSGCCCTGVSDAALCSLSNQREG